jgi:hypothetical protein
MFENLAFSPPQSLPPRGLCGKSGLFAPPTLVFFTNVHDESGCRSQENEKLMHVAINEIQ